MSIEGKIYQDLTTDEGSYRQTFGQDRISFEDEQKWEHFEGLFADRAGFGFQHHRLVILSLGLLNAALLIAAAVIGIYCANAKDLQVSDLAATPLILEMNFLRNHTGIMKAKAEAQSALMRERADFARLKLEMTQNKANIDRLEKRIRTLQAEKTDLQSNRTALEQNCARCPSGWVLIKTACYYFSKHNEADLKNNWSESRADCLSKGSDLVAINNLEEQQTISANFPRQESSSNMWWLNGYWIGLKAVQVQGPWMWVKNKTEASSMYWRSGYPQNSQTWNGNCAAFLYYADTMSTWYNANCQENLLNWICEMEPRRN